MRRFSSRKADTSPPAAALAWAVASYRTRHGRVADADLRCAAASLAAYRGRHRRVADTSPATPSGSRLLLRPRRLRLRRLAGRLGRALRLQDMSWDVSRTCLPPCRRAGRIFAISATLCFLGLDLG